MRHAFSIIELLIVIVIIMIIALVAVPLLVNEREATRQRVGPSRVVHRYYSEAMMAWRLVLREGDGRTSDLQVTYDDYERATIGVTWPLTPELEAK